ncbi:MAG TPA: LamG domain-containing protein [Opitutus sp.]|nr:LamG domain-containing protein [Opitutus sp.]
MGVTENVATVVTITDGNWHHVAFVNEGAASHKLYIDGVLAAESTALWSQNNTNNQPVHIGRDRNAGTADTYFTGTIDDVAILQHALTLEEIQDLNHLPHP